MRFMASKHQPLKKTFSESVVCATLLSLLIAASAQAEPYLPSFADYGKGDPHVLPPEGRMVVMSSDMALITAQKFALPLGNTFQYPLIGLTMFPYYKASAPLQDFLNAARVNGVPVTYGNVTTNFFNALPPTDTTRISIPIPQRRETKSTRLAMNGGLHDEVPWHVASQGGQSFSVPGDPEALVLASAGTMFNGAGNRIIGLRCGTLWVFAGAQPVTVLTKYGAARVKPFSIAAVEQTWFNRVRIGDLAGGPVDVHISHKGHDSELSIGKGKEYTFTESAVASTGVSDVAVQGRTAIAPPLVPSLNTVTKTIDPDVSGLVAELKGVKPPFTSLRMASQFERMMKDLGVTPAMRRNEEQKLALKKEELQKPSTYKASLDSRYFVPVYKPVRATGPVPFPRVDSGLNTKWLAHGYAKYLGSSKFGVDADGKLTLDHGEAIFEAKDHMRIRAGEVVVDCQPGSIVYLNAKKDVIVVRNLKEMYEKNVMMRVGGRSLKCAAGQEMVVGNEIPSVVNEMKSDGVGRRNVRAIETLSGNVLINKSEYSMTSFMQFSPIMRALYNSKNEGDKQLLSDLIKMDAVLQLVTGKRGTYQRMSGLPTHGL